MSTRACIARRDGDSSWTGSYVHSDGYPDVTGRVLVEMVREMGAEAVLAYAATVPQGWTRFPDEPSICHDEPRIMSPQQDGGAEWLYLIAGDFEIKVYRGDPDGRRFTRVGTIDPSHPDAARHMAAIARVSSTDDAVLPDLEGRAPTGAEASSPEPIRSWHERVRDMRDRAEVLATLGPDRPPCVLMLPHGFRADPELLVQEILGYIDPDLLDDRLYVEPTQEEIDEWMIDMMDDGGEE